MKKNSINLFVILSSMSLFINSNAQKTYLLSPIVGLIDHDECIKIGNEYVYEPTEQVNQSKIFQWNEHRFELVIFNDGGPGQYLPYKDIPQDLAEMIKEKHLQQEIQDFNHYLKSYSNATKDIHNTTKQINKLITKVTLNLFKHMMYTDEEQTYKIILPSQIKNKSELINEIDYLSRQLNGYVKRQAGEMCGHYPYVNLDEVEEYASPDKNSLPQRLTETAKEKTLNPLGPSYQHQIPLGPSYQNQSPLGPCYQNQIPLGPCYQNQIPLGPCYQNQIPLGPSSYQDQRVLNQSNPDNTSSPQKLYKRRILTKYQKYQKLLENQSNPDNTSSPQKLYKRRILTKYQKYQKLLEIITITKKINGLIETNHITQKIIKLLQEKFDIYLFTYLQNVSNDNEEYINKEYIIRECKMIILDPSIHTKADNLIKEVKNLFNALSYSDDAATNPLKDNPYIQVVDDFLEEIEKIEKHTLSTKEPLEIKKERASDAETSYSKTQRF